MMFIITTPMGTKELVVVEPESQRPNEVLTNDQPQITNRSVVQPSNKVQPPPIHFPKRLRKEKDEAQQRKFLENLKQLHINLPFIEALAQVPKYAKFLKGLLTNKVRLEEACKIIMNERCSAVLLNKLPSKEKDPGSFTIPCDIGQLHIDNALADLGASISLMPYTMYKKLGLGEPKATRMSLELGDRYARRFKSPTTEEVGMLRIDDLDDYDHERSKLVVNDKNGSDLENSIQHFNSINTPYPVTQRTSNGDNVRSEHMYSASANEIDEKKSALKNLPQHLEYVYLHGINLFPLLFHQNCPKMRKDHFCKYWREEKGQLLRKYSSWVSPIHVVPKKGGMTVVLNDNNELIPSRIVTGWRVCIDYRKLNDATQKDHFPLPFIDQMLDRLCGNEYYCFLDGFFRILPHTIATKGQEKTPSPVLIGLSLSDKIAVWIMFAPATFQRCHEAIFHGMVERLYESFLWTTSRCLDTISGAGIKVNRAKIDVIAKLPYPTNVKGVRSFIGHAGFYRSLIYTDHSALKYLFSKEDVKPRRIRSSVKDLRGETQIWDLLEEEITNEFLDKHLMILKAELNNDEP
ncbi:reverse transcriptase domain-containing protein [Tanacetum coccineum]